MSNNLLCTLLFLISTLATPVLADEHVDLSRFVVVGDSLAAGFQNFSLLGTQQENGPAALIARQARIPLAQPLVPYPGAPNVLQLISPGVLPVIEPVPGSLPLIPRLAPFVQATNLAVPGQTVNDALVKRPGPVFGLVDALTNIVLGFPTPFLIPGPPRSQLEWAVALSPSFVLLWIGNNDALFAALTGDLSLLTPLAAFEQSYNQLSTTLAATHATMVYVNLPDVTLTPYFLSVRKFAAQAGVPAALVAQILGLQEDDYLRPGAIPIALSILQNQQPGPLPLLCPAGVLPFPGVACALRASEAAILRGALNAYNQVIAARARATGGALVDLDSLFRQLATDGYKVNGRNLDTSFLGGLFSLDGFHPTNTGYAILANEILEQMKRQLHINITTVNMTQVVKDDPLVFTRQGKTH